MPDPTAIRPFEFDWDYDRDNADTGTRSRYGNYLYQRTKSFEDIWTDDKSIEFAATAWRIATSPILVPPLICAHPRVINVSLQRSEWDGEMIGDVRLISPRPQPLAHAKTGAGGYYSDYRRNWNDEYQGIGSEDLTREAFLLTETRLLWQLPKGELPTIAEIPTSSDALFPQAVECLEVLVGALNREVGPILARMEEG